MPRRWDAGMGRNLKAMLDARGMTQRDLAEGAGMADATVCRYVRGQRGPSFGNLCAMAEALGMTVGDFAREVVGE